MRLARSPAVPTGQQRGFTPIAKQAAKPCLVTPRRPVAPTKGSISRSANAPNGFACRAGRFTPAASQGVRGRHTACSSQCGATNLLQPSRPPAAKPRSPTRRHTWLPPARTPREPRPGRNWQNLSIGWRAGRRCRARISEGRRSSSVPGLRCIGARRTVSKDNSSTGTALGTDSREKQMGQSRIGVRDSIAGFPQIRRNPLSK